MRLCVRVFPCARDKGTCLTLANHPIWKQILTGFPGSVPRAGRQDDGGEHPSHVEQVASPPDFCLGEGQVRGWQARYGLHRRRREEGKRLLRVHSLTLIGAFGGFGNDSTQHHYKGEGCWDVFTLKTSKAWVVGNRHFSRFDAVTRG